MELIVKMDDSGRMVLPKSLRDAAKSNSFVAKLQGNSIVLKPIPGWKEMFGSLPALDMKKFAQQHREDSRD